MSDIRMIMKQSVKMSKFFEKYLKVMTIIHDKANNNQEVEEVEQRKHARG